MRKSPLIVVLLAMALVMGACGDDDAATTTTTAGTTTTTTAEWPETLVSQQAHAFALTRIARQIKEFPGYTRIRRAILLAEPWTIENGLLTPTLKLKRAKALERYRAEYEKLYEGYSQ